MENVFNPNQIWDFVIKVLQERHPLFILWLAGQGAIVLFVTQFLKKQKNLQGNMVQILAAVASVVIATVQALLGGVFKDGVQGNDIEGVMLLGAAGWMAATWGYSVMTNRNNRPPPVIPVQGDAGVRDEIEEARRRVGDSS
jgi:hypothetical protein